MAVFSAAALAPQLGNLPIIVRKRMAERREMVIHTRAVSVTFFWLLQPCLFLLNPLQASQQLLAVLDRTDRRLGVVDVERLGLFSAFMSIASIRHYYRCVEVLALRDVQATVEVADCGVMVLAPAFSLFDVQHWVRESCFRRVQGVGDVVNRHPSLFGQGDNIVMRYCAFEEVFGWLALMHIHDTWETVRAGVAVRHLETERTLSWLFVKVLSIKWMTVLVRFAITHAPTIVPVLWTRLLLLGCFYRLNYVNELLRLVISTATIHFIFVNAYRIVPLNELRLFCSLFLGCSQAR